MVRWGSAPSSEQRDWGQNPMFSLCQPIASRDRALDIWPCHPDDCRWCISQLGSTLSSMKLWEWLETEREKTRGRMLDQVKFLHGGISKAGLISSLVLFIYFLYMCSALRQLLVYLSHWGMFTAMLDHGPARGSDHGRTASNPTFTTTSKCHKREEVALWDVPASRPPGWCVIEGFI